MRLTVAAVTARTFTASKDTYIDLSSAGAITYTEVSNNAASPALSANNIRIGIIVTGATTIATTGSINQGEIGKALPIASSVAYEVTDSLGNLICPRDSNRRQLGLRTVASFSTASTSATQVTGATLPILGVAGRKVRIRMNIPSFSSNAANVPIAILWDGAVGGTSLTQINGIASSTISSPAVLEIEVAASAALKTYNISLHENVSGTASMTAIVAGSMQLRADLV